MYLYVQNVRMIAEHSSTEPTAAVLLGEHIRDARKRRGWSIAEMAEKLGRPREWLNRVELGYSEYGEYKPASLAELEIIIDYLKQALQLAPEELLALGAEAERQFYATKLESRRARRNSVGKLTQTEVLVGEKHIVHAIVDLIHEQHSDAVIRNTGIKTTGTYVNITPEWREYSLALGEFLEHNPHALFKRLEFAAQPEHLEHAKSSDSRLAGTRATKQVHNAKSKFHRHNPLQLHVVIGQREAILALPQTAGQAGSNIALLIRDKIFVEALRVWYDEVLWDAPGETMSVDFNQFDESYEDIGRMYGFDTPDKN